MLADDHQRLMIVGINGQDVGYAEIYEGKRDRLARYYKGEDNDLGWHLLFGEKSAFGQGFLRPTIRLLNFYIFENSPTNRIVGEPDHTVKPYAAVVEDMCYEEQGLIPMPEKRQCCITVSVKSSMTDFLSYTRHRNKNYSKKRVNFWYG